MYSPWRGKADTLTVLRKVLCYYSELVASSGELGSDCQTGDACSDYDCIEGHLAASRNVADIDKKTTECTD